MVNGGVNTGDELWEAPQSDDLVFTKVLDLPAALRQNGSLRGIGASPDTYRYHGKWTRNTATENVFPEDTNMWEASGYRWGAPTKIAMFLPLNFTKVLPLTFQEVKRP